MALTVKSALAGALGPAADAPLNDAGTHVANGAQRVLARASGFEGQAQTRLEAAITRAPLDSERKGLSSRRPGRAALPAGTSGPRPDGEIAQGQTQVRRILRNAAVRHGIDPRLVLALSYWESGWDQSRVSQTGAIGIMQVEPDSAAEAGPALLGHPVDINDLYENADVGAAILREDLDHYRDPAMALAAYYQGPGSLEQYGMLPDTQQYVQGILTLAGRISD